jgi:hypothetical protein
VIVLRGLALLAGVILLRELYLALGPRRVRRRRGYEQALLRARETGKPLVVLGAPGTGAVNATLGPDYGCGDLCIDLVGCEGCPTSATGPAELVLPELADDSAVVFVSCTLEYVQDVDRVWRELLRVSGGDLYVVTVEPLSLTAWFYPGARQVIGTATPERPLRYKRLPWAAPALLPAA